MKKGLRFTIGWIARLTAVLALAFASVPAGSTQPASPQNGANLLVNGGFETFSGGVAERWEVWSADDDPLNAPGYAADTTAHSGSFAQRLSWRSEAAGRPMHGGLYQRVSGLTIGHAVSFEAWHYWPDDPQDGTQSVTVRVGIDPAGGTDPDNAEWLASTYASTQWQQLRAVTTAISTTVTVFLSAKTQYPKEAYVLWDDAVLTANPWQTVHLPLTARNYAPPCTLRNGGFEGSYVQVADGTRVAEYWSPWWNDDYDPVELRNAKPEYNETTSPPDPAYRVRAGEKSQQYGVTWKHYQGGVYQQLTGCPAGTVLQFSAYGLGYAARAIESTTSDPDGELMMKVGIDPTGDIDPTDPASGVVWSEGAVSLDAYARFEITATVQGPTVTLFLYAEPLHHSPQDLWFHNTAYWDDTGLQKLP